MDCFHRTISGILVNIPGPFLEDLMAMRNFFLSKLKHILGYVEQDVPKRISNGFVALGDIYPMTESVVLSPWHAPKLSKSHFHSVGAFLDHSQKHDSSFVVLQLSPSVVQAHKLIVPNCHSLLESVSLTTSK